MDFLIDTFTLFLSIRGRINFLKHARYGNHKEQRYRQQFEKPFDFLAFNKELTLSQVSGRYAIDIDNHTAFHLGAVQTLNSDDQNLSDWYAGVISSDMHLVSRLRDDADLRYLCKEPPTGKRGMPKKYDGKQHTGLNDSQARSENKLHFQFNASLTSINIAKAIHWLSIPKERRGAFSMADIKTMNHNALMLNRFFDVFGICPHSTKNQNYVKELILYDGTMAA